MRSIPVRLLLLASLTVCACRSNTAEQENARRAGAAAQGLDVRVIPFQHADARLAANHARAEFGQPPMEGVVKLECDARTNSWVVQALPADLARVEAIAARYDR